MKKSLIVLLLFIVAALTFFSCGNNGPEEETSAKKAEETSFSLTESIVSETEKEVKSPEKEGFMKTFEAPKGDPRQIVKDYFYKMANYEWTPAETFSIGWKDSERFTINLTYEAGKKYKGPIYGATNCDYFCFDEFVSDKGFSFPRIYSTSSDENVIFYQEVVGNHCSGSVTLAIQQLINFPKSDLIECESRNGAVKVVGNLVLPNTDKANFKKGYYTEDLWACNDISSVYEAYAQMQTGDILNKCVKQNGHVRMVERVELKKLVTGDIDYENSLVYCNEQTNTFDSKLEPGADYQTTWWLSNHPYTFKNLYDTNFAPFTLAVYTSGEELKDAYISLSEYNSPDRISKELLGKVTSNFPLNFVHLTIKDTSGNIVSEDLAYNLASKKYAETYSEPLRKHHYKLIENANLQEGQTYTYTLKAGIARGSVVLENFEFTYKK